ncbi:MAG: hypothetical protein PHT51_03600 [Patescibacteria group bacterium]|nr:hypothetical protein [Patescibacteria group bacterium]MDD4610955.1 hypothetical protein [Patescibacteria group bacterium]
MDNNQDKKEYSEEKDNVEIIKRKDLEIEKKAEDAVIVNQEGLDVKKGGNIIIGTLNVFAKGLKNRHEKHYKNSKFHLVADLVLLAIILALAGVLVWLNFWPTQNKDLVLDIKQSSEVIVSGQPETFEIDYKYTAEGGIDNVNLAVDLPKNFILETVVPKNIFDEKNNTFAIGSLGEGANGKIKITGIVVGEVGSRQVLSSAMSYKRNGRILNNLGSLAYNIESSVLNLKMNLPEKIYRNFEFGGQVDVENNSDRDLKNVELTFGNGWQIRETKCSASISLKDNIISIKEIKAHEKINIEFFAQTDKEGETQSFAIISYLKINNELFKQGEIEKKVGVKESNFKINLSTSDRILSLGKKANFNIAYKNLESETIKNVEIIIAPGNANFIIDSSQINNNKKAYKMIGNRILVGDIKPGEEGGFDLAVDFDRIKKEPEQEFYLATRSVFNISGQELKYNLLSPKIKILTDLKVKSNGYYYSPQGDQLGVGPVPPIVGVPTTYWVIWEVDNYGNGLNNFKLLGDLPANVAWTGNDSMLAGKLSHGEVGNQVIWEIDNIDKSGGNYKAGFEIQIIPTKDDVGKLLTLLSDIHYQATDNFCSQELSGNFKNITTNLESDKFVFGKGVVVSE